MCLDTWLGTCYRDKIRRSLDNGFLEEVCIKGSSLRTLRKKTWFDLI